MDWSPKNYPSRVSLDAIREQIGDCIQSLKNLMRGHGDGTRGFTMVWPNRGEKVTLGMDPGSYGQLSESAKFAKEKRTAGRINENYG